MTEERNPIFDAMTKAGAGSMCLTCGTVLADPYADCKCGTDNENDVDKPDTTMEDGSYGDQR